MMVDGHRFVVLVCGGRGYADRRTVALVLGAIHAARTITTLVHGADALAGWWARSHGVGEVGVTADWVRFGRAAGPIRNKRMLVEQRPDLVVAFPGGRGTANMMAQAVDHRVQVFEVP